jgi:hypothetical protein
MVIVLKGEILKPRLRRRLEEMIAARNATHSKSNDNIVPFSTLFIEPDTNCCIKGKIPARIATEIAFVTANMVALNLPSFNTSSRSFERTSFFLRSLRKSFII